MILFWATFTALLGCVWPAGCRVDPPVRNLHWEEVVLELTVKTRGNTL